MSGRGRALRFDAPNPGNHFTETFDIVRPGRGRPKPDRDTHPPPSRRLPHRSRERRSKPPPVSESGLHDDSHIPTFGTWNVDADQNYTGIFQAASQAKKGEALGAPTALEMPSAGRGSIASGDLYKPRHSKKRSSPWCCFGA